MKKILAFILAAVLAFSGAFAVCGLAFDFGCKDESQATPAAEPEEPEFEIAEKCDCGTTPVIFIEGFGKLIEQNPGTEEAVDVFPPETAFILKSAPDLLKAIYDMIVTEDYDEFADLVAKVIKTMFNFLALDSDGNAKSGTGVDWELPVYDKHEYRHYRLDGDRAAARDGDYLFQYDWRLSPLDNAEGLNSLVERVKLLTGHDKLTFVSFSEGNNITLSYIYKYGTDSIEKCVFISPAWQGLSVVGDLFSGDPILGGEKTDILTTFVNAMSGEVSDMLPEVVASILDKATGIGATSFVLDYAQRVVNNAYAEILDSSIVTTFGTMPGIWSFVPPEYYSAAKEYMFAGRETEYAGIISKTDEYYENVQTKVTDTVSDLRAEGIPVSIVSGYGIPNVPLGETVNSQSDMVIDTKYTSLGATCAPVGGNLGEDYVQAVNCGHNHISPDNVIDASTCAFPEITWFIYGRQHSEFPNEFLSFLDWLILYDTEPDVSDTSRYSQFMTLEDLEEGFEEFEGTPEEKDNDDNDNGFGFASFSEIFGSVRNKIRGFFNKIKDFFKTVKRIVTLLNDESMYA